MRHKEYQAARNALAEGLDYYIRLPNSLYRGRLLSCRDNLFHIEVFDVEEDGEV